MSLAMKRGSFRSGMKTSGWRLSISYRALVPLLWCPTTKKSGYRRLRCAVLRPRPRERRAGSADMSEVTIRGRAGWALARLRRAAGEGLFASHRDGSLRVPALGRDPARAPARARPRAIRDLDLAGGDRPGLRRGLRSRPRAGRSARREAQPPGLRDRRAGGGGGPADVPRRRRLPDRRPDAPDRRGAAGARSCSRCAARRTSATASRTRCSA